MAALVSSVIDRLIADYSLGGAVRNIDFGGQYGDTVGMEMGHGDVSGTMCRVADITLPIIVDGTATLAP